MPAIQCTFGDERVLARLWSKVVNAESGCWLFVGGCDPDGYGIVWFGGTSVRAHRHFYTVLVGPIEAETLDHLCRVRCCVNPAHLDPVSNWENQVRGNTITSRKLAQTHCLRGHPLSGENLLVKSDGHRRCRKCRNLNSREYSALRRATRRAALESSRPQPSADPR